MAMGLQTASRPARRQAWYIYGPIFFHHEPGFSRRPARDDPSLLGLSRAGLAGWLPARPTPDGHGSGERGPWRFGLLPARPQSAGRWYIHKIFFLNLIYYYYFFFVFKKDYYCYFFYSSFFMNFVLYP